MSYRLHYRMQMHDMSDIMQMCIRCQEICNVSRAKCIGHIEHIIVLVSVMDSHSSHLLFSCHSGTAINLVFLLMSLQHSEY